MAPVGVRVFPLPARSSADKAFFLGLDQLIVGFRAWAFIPNYFFSDAATCTRQNDQGWSYVWYTSEAFVFPLYILRVAFILLEETPNTLLPKER